MSDVVDRILKFNAGRNPQLVAIKYKKMRKDKFAFFRGTCHLFYEDWPKNSPLNKTPATWICGDLHLQNFGIYQGDDGLIYFDINDFDESLLAPVVWDTARFLTSILLGFSNTKPSQRKALLQQYLDSYTTTLAKGQTRSIHTAVAHPPLRNVMQKRQVRGVIGLLNEYSITSKKIRHFKISTRKIRSVSEDTRQQAITILKSWSDSQPKTETYKVFDVATRLSGLGSMGVERYLVLIGSPGLPNNNRLLELKERNAPAPQAYSKQHQPSWSNAAERVVTLQNRLQAIPPAPLAAIAHAEKAYTVREIAPADEKIDPKDFKRSDDWKTLVEAMGSSTAYAHLRGCGRQGSSSASDLISFAADTTWHKTLLDYVNDYCQHIAGDYLAFCAAKLGNHQ